MTLKVQSMQLESLQLDVPTGGTVRSSGSQISSDMHRSSVSRVREGQDRLCEGNCAEGAHSDNLETVWNRSRGVSKMCV